MLKMSASQTCYNGKFSFLNISLTHIFSRVFSKYVVKNFPERIACDCHYRVPTIVVIVKGPRVPQFQRVGFFFTIQGPFANLLKFQNFFLAPQGRSLPKNCAFFSFFVRSRCRPVG